MRDLGRAAATDFLEANFDSIGVAATLDLSAELSAEILPQKSGRHVQEMMEAIKARG